MFRECYKIKLTHEEVIIDLHTWHKVYVAGKHVWDPVTIIAPDSIDNKVAKRIREQLQRQVNLTQTAYAAGGDYKFDTFIEILDGKDARATESWKLEGSFIPKR